MISAKTIEEAVAQAVTELGAPSADQIEYTVLEEPKKGFLGLGAQDAKISATYVSGGEARAIAFVEKLLADMNIDAEMTVTEGENGEVRIAIVGESASVLIGHHG
ncbi:MAG: Jag N-terminal domain-containing protein, partial [Clostridia bacterium]|nr:Jag N-terminal domain-containing protein [Clostridia bacterium]